MSESDKAARDILMGKIPLKKSIRLYENQHSNCSDCLSLDHIADNGWDEGYWNEKDEFGADTVSCPLLIDQKHHSITFVSQRAKFVIMKSCIICIRSSLILNNCDSYRILGSTTDEMQ